MSEHAPPQSPLVRFGLPGRAVSDPGGASLRIGERAFHGYVNLRGDPGDARFLGAVKEILGAGLPVEPNTFVANDDYTVCWLGPDEWLVITPHDRGPATAAALDGALAGQRAAVTEITGGNTEILIAGASARDLIAQGCTLDLHARAFGPGRCAQSVMAKAPIMIRQVDDAPTFHVVVRRSFADYLWQWVEEGAAGYGGVIVAQ